MSKANGHPPKEKRADVNIFCVQSERDLIVRAAEILGYTSRPGSTHGYSRYCREVLLQHAKDTIAEAEKQVTAETKPKRKRSK